MEKKEMGVLNKNENHNKQIVVLVAAIAAVIAITAIVLNFINTNKEKNKIDVASIVSKAETKIIYVGSSDSKKCKDCKEIEKYLDSQKINYVTYDVEDYTEKEYTEMLRTIEINPDDFGYPAVIYIREGRLYSNVINLTDTKPVQEFIKTYELKNVK